MGPKLVVIQKSQYSIVVKGKFGEMKSEFCFVMYDQSDHQLFKRLYFYV